MSWEVFNGWHKWANKPSRQVPGPLVTIAEDSKGRVYLIVNKSAVPMLGGAALVEVAVDRGRELLGLRPMTTQTNQSYSVVPASNGTTARVNAGNFFRQFASGHRRVWVEDGWLVFRAQPDVG